MTLFTRHQELLPSSFNQLTMYSNSQNDASKTSLVTFLFREYNGEAATFQNSGGVLATGYEIASELDRQLKVDSVLKTMLLLSNQLLVPRERKTSVSYEQALESVLSYIGPGEYDPAGQLNKLRTAHQYPVVHRLLSLSKLP